MSTDSACRLRVILARAAPRAVIFRRGPSKQVLLSTWDLQTDAVEHGQWLRARVHDERSDLSPSGTYLVYCAARHKGPLPRWTAISKPPYWTALVVYPTPLFGGGLFLDETQVGINAGPGPLAPTADSLHPRHFQASPLHGYTGPPRLTRDGWILRQAGKSAAQPQRRGGPRYALDPPTIHARPHPRSGAIELERRVVGHGELGGAWEILEFALVGRERVELGRLDWADWAPNGDLLLADEGRLFRARLGGGVLGERRLVEDLRPLRFTEVTAPPAALAVTRRSQR